jgi:hypothetical protein
MADYAPVIVRAATGSWSTGDLFYARQVMAISNSASFKS